jgi:hypothetical protein
MKRRRATIIGLVGRLFVYSLSLVATVIVTAAIFVAIVSGDAAVFVVRRLPRRKKAPKGSAVSQ